MKHETYVRKAKVIRVVNGNTLDLEINLGFGIKLERRVDLARLVPHAPYSTNDMGQKVWLQSQFHIVKDVTIQFDEHPEDNQRIIAEVWNDLGINITDMMIDLLQDAELDPQLSLNVLG